MSFIMVLALRECCYHFATQDNLLKLERDQKQIRPQKIAKNIGIV